MAAYKLIVGISDRVFYVFLYSHTLTDILGIYGLKEGIQPSVPFHHGPGKLSAGDDLEIPPEIRAHHRSSGFILLHGLAQILIYGIDIVLYIFIDLIGI